MKAHKMVAYVSYFVKLLGQKDLILSMYTVIIQ